MSPAQRSSPVSYQVEHWRQGAWHTLSASNDESVSIDFYLQTRTLHPDWAIRRITIHETTV